MLKRLRWMILGAATGVGAYVWLTRKAKEKVPEAAADAVGQARKTAGALGARVREALRDGRAAFKDRQGELSRDLLPRE